MTTETVVKGGNLGVSNRVPRDGVRHSDSDLVIVLMVAFESSFVIVRMRVARVVMLVLVRMLLMLVGMLNVGVRVSNVVMLVLMGM